MSNRIYIEQRIVNNNHREIVIKDDYGNILITNYRPCTTHKDIYIAVYKEDRDLIDSGSSVDSMLGYNQGVSIKTQDEENFTYYSSGELEDWTEQATKEIMSENENDNS